ncbi:2-succinyl-5-enolpyruvyl-6-hydroxy-3-cyclohexene-1-carboxylic-acid synthase [Actinomyces sp.]|uniref:2-succinyl-5-enolpyruvyl-6-hydroxy-3- cyclohexene-1-carboxylic-acid synthase n=1 Tax=Actinomyces sp. TaxID=29317 RepID=UPI0026DCB14D|nr:2-succinyl-5-enolpyruvyl-6-hydroxy-3-cyclohexene-1-carboxylic-acid synthase [Actinomyces sp.]MDO4899307.1 2-succinyl-5-enolpyruvyl-6-hydroxy-3-cyclohexene-1-carboxylic-acid synthase [Actinomyces sp.]
MSITDPAAPGTASVTVPARPPSLLAAHAVVAALIRGGVRQVILAPGSRSAPLIPALAAAEREGRLRVRVAIDERSAAYMALGCSRAELRAGSRCPAAVVTTSGTAVANLHPAVAEADAAGVPLILVTADRPHEAVGTGANQTTEQTRIFGAAPRAVIDLPADITADLGETAASHAIAGQVRRLVDAATGRTNNDPGPAQLNVRFRPPLAPAAGMDHRSGVVQDPIPVPAAPVSAAPSALSPPAAGGGAASRYRPRHEDERGVVIAGDGLETAGRYARALAEQLDWPLLAEPTSGARGGPQALTRYAELLASPAGTRLADQVERIVVTGHPSLTRQVGALLARGDLPIDVLTTTARWTDVAGTAARIVPLGAPAAISTHPDTGLLPPPADLAATLGFGGGPPGWARAWRDAVASLPSPLARNRLDADTAVAAVWEASRDCDCAPLLVVGSSLTIRRLDRLATPAVGPAPAAIANRGLAGIDGTLATALGAAITAGPVRAVVGDLTFLHDAMSLLRGGMEVEPDLQVVVVDDGGGAIFSTLEYPAVTPRADLARYFTTPQAVDPGALAAALGATVHRPPDLAALRALLAAPVRGVSMVHIRIPTASDQRAAR